MTVPLPELDQIEIVSMHYPGVITVQGYSADSMHAHAAAVLAANIHSCGPTCTRAGCVNAELLKHNSDMRAEITALRVTLLTVRANLLHRFPTSGSLLVAEIDAALGSQP